MIDDISIRQATIEDIPDLVRLRRLMFESMGHDNPAQLDAADRAATAYFGDAMPRGEFYGWLAVTAEGEAVGNCHPMFETIAHKACAVNGLCAVDPAVELCYNRS